MDGSDAYDPGVATSSSREEFARALRVHRLRASLTQEELAHRSGISVRTVRNVESGTVGVPRLATLRTIADTLGLDPVERAAFVELAGVGVDPTRPAAGGRIPVALSRLVGRDEDVAELTALITRRSDRLVTLTGVAGIGKTRLAMAATLALSGGPWRAWWVPLAPVGDSTYILDAVAEALGAPGAGLDALGAWVGDASTLLAIDNVEHLQDAGEVLAGLLREVPSLTVLSTSRAPLGVPGEREWPVRPLAVPTEESDDGQPGEPSVAASVELLLERVQATVPDFVAAGAAAEDVAEICRLVGGVPLALELAACQWRVLGSRGVLEAISANPLDLHDLGGSRLAVHASLRVALNASATLLTEAERHTFQCLSAFRGGWTVAAAAQVAAADGVVDHLDRLIALGLVEASRPGPDELRFTMLKPIEAFAVELAVASGVREAADERHARWVAAMVAASELDLRSGVAQAAVRRLDSERDNVRAALRWFEQHDPEGGVAVVLIMHRYWVLRNRNDEGLAWFGTFLDLAGSSERAAHARVMAASVAVSAGRLEEAQTLAEQALADHRRVQDDRGASMALVVLGMVAAREGALDVSARSTAEALEIAQHLDDPWLLTWALSNLGQSLGELGRLAEARQHVERARALARANGFLASEAWSLLHLANQHRLEGDLALARDRAAECSVLLPSVNHVELDVLCPAIEAVLAAAANDLERADELSRNAQLTAGSAGPYARGMAAWARAEVVLALDHTSSVGFSAALTDLRDPARPLTQVEVLVGIAHTTHAAGTASEALDAADAIIATYELEIPATIGARRAAADRRWATQRGR